ncbi:uncharacterized protein B0T15DRAFT_545733 [Chaetomium strumarium]|uniref:NmrA-like domain-containing protein n=1 Tax=Chaetomium strumarium TaxID=1170767 RepID=A0AAJ0H0U9_9PEZI|nr:hypothetical protein B0T15DRAFT_545733 [Chaetomium strumarium]
MSPKIFVIGGTGAQGLPVIRGLVHDGKYTVRVLTRDTTSRRAQELAGLGPNVELVQGTFTSEADLRAGFTGAWGAFINIDGFATGEAMETYWTIRAYELAIEHGVQFYVHGNLDYVYKLSGYNQAHRCGHYDGKGRMGEWIQLQRQASKGVGMKAALFTTGPYIEMALCQQTPMEPVIETDESGEHVLVWKVPLTAEGGVAHVALDDCAHYVRWLFDNPERADGMDLAVAIDSIHYSDMAKAFEKVTGHKARYVDVDMDTFFSGPHWSRVASFPTGYMVDPKSPAAMTTRDNFTGFWRMRDYALLDEIHPNRIRSAEEFFRREDEKAKKNGRGSLWDMVLDPRPILKIHEDRRLASRSK